MPARFSGAAFIRTDGDDTDVLVGVGGGVGVRVGVSERVAPAARGVPVPERVGDCEGTREGDAEAPPGT